MNENKSTLFEALHQLEHKIVDTLKNIQHDPKQTQLNRLISLQSEIATSRITLKQNLVKEIMGNLVISTTTSDEIHNNNRLIDLKCNQYIKIISELRDLMLDRITD